MKAVILAGGYGTRISEESSVRPKPMVEIGDKPKLDDSVFGRGSFAAAENLSIIYKARSNTLSLKADQYFQLAKQLKEKAAGPTIQSA